MVDTSARGRTAPGRYFVQHPAEAGGLGVGQEPFPPALGINRDGPTRIAVFRSHAPAPGEGIHVRQRLECHVLATGGVSQRRSCSSMTCLRSTAGSGSLPSVGTIWRLTTLRAVFGVCSNARHGLRDSAAPGLSRFFSCPHLGFISVYLATAYSREAGHVSPTVYRKQFRDARRIGGARG